MGRLLLEDGHDAGEAMVYSGYAWWYRRYAETDARLERFEELARSARGCP